MSVEKTVTTEMLVTALKGLQKKTPYSYIHEATKTVVSIENIDGPCGPITIRRWNPSEGQTHDTAPDESISMQMLSRVANAFSEGTPLNIDRLLGASYNTRSALETLLCHTPQFYYCFPGRIENVNGKCKIKKGHKHTIWFPEDPHDNGVLVEKEIKNLEINEIPSKNVIYNAVEIPPQEIKAGKVDTPETRIHLHMQMALYEIGRGLGLDYFIAKNDQGTIYKGQIITNHDHVIADLSSTPIVGSFDGAAKAGHLIDAMWLEAKNIPAVFEVENSTGVTSGLTRMQNFKKTLPPLAGTYYVIIAPDDLRDKVTNEINKPEFRDLHAYYMPYSAVSELLGLVQERQLKGVTPAFLETFLEDVFV